MPSASALGECVDYRSMRYVMDENKARAPKTTIKALEAGIEALEGRIDTLADAMSKLVGVLTAQTSAQAPAFIPRQEPVEAPKQAQVKPSKAPLVVTEGMTYALRIAAWAAEKAQVIDHATSVDCDFRRYIGFFTADEAVKVINASKKGNHEGIALLHSVVKGRKAAGKTVA